MADNYTQCTPECALKATKEEADNLIKLLDNQDIENDVCHGFRGEYYEETGKFYMFAEDNTNEGDLSEEFLKTLGKLIKKNTLPYLEFGYACTCSKMRPGEFGGGYFRINTKGEILYPELKW